MPTTLSRSKDSIKFLLLEGISTTAVNALAGAGYTNVERLTKALSGQALRDALHGVSMVGIRSRTQLTAEALDGQRSVMAIGCFSVGTNQVALEAARDMGVPVFNAPFSNTRSVAELTIAEIVMLARGTFPKSQSRMRRGTSRPSLQRGARQDARHHGYNIGSRRPNSPKPWACASSSTIPPTS
jgi:D-3-phosphoglycerate dehydrogenase